MTIDWAKCTTEAEKIKARQLATVAEGFCWYDQTRLVQLTPAEATEYPRAVGYCHTCNAIVGSGRLYPGITSCWQILEARTP